MLVEDPTPRPTPAGPSREQQLEQMVRDLVALLRQRSTPPAVTVHPDIKLPDSPARPPSSYRCRLERNDFGALEEIIITPTHG